MELCNLLKQLVSFRTTEENPQEIRRGFEYVVSLFDLERFDAQFLEKNGKCALLVSFKGRNSLRPKILLNGHFDVVPAESEGDFELRVEGDRAFGRGAADMKGMAAVLIQVMQALGRQPNPPDVALLLTGDEEVGGENGAGYAVKGFDLKPGFVLCADGTHNEREILTKEKGGVWIELRTRGMTAHAAYPWKGENALEKILRAIEKIRAFVGPTKPEAWKSTCNLAVIETSNKTPNKVPADARAVLDVRFTEELATTPEELIDKIRDLVPEVDIAPLTKVSLMVIDVENPLLQTFKKIADKIIGNSIPLRFGHGATDARYFAEIGVPVIIFGGKGGNWHAAGEWVSLQSLEENRSILLEFLKSA